MAPFTLTIVFLGLVSFVPVQNANGHLEAVWVLLPNAEDADPRCADMNGGHESHYAALRYAARNLSGGVVSTTGSEPMVLTYLRETDIRIVAPGGKPLESTADCPSEPTAIRRHGRSALAATDETMPLATTPCDRFAFSWVTDLHKLAGDLGHVFEKCLEETPSVNYPWDRVASRIKLTTGLLRSETLSQYYDAASGKSTYLVYEYPKGTNPIFKQVVGEDVSLTIQGITEPVVFVLARKDKGQESITLVPGKNSDGRREDEVRVEILSKPGWALIGAPQPANSPEDLRDFRFYYDLSDATCPNEVPIPKSSEPEAGPPICPAAVLVADGG